MMLHSGNKNMDFFSMDLDRNGCDDIFGVYMGLAAGSPLQPAMAHK